MGNCHAVDPVCATVEHPNGTVEKLYFSSSARQLMLQYPGHYVALLPPPPIPSIDGGEGNLRRKAKLLQPDTLLSVGCCYRLVTFEDVLSELSDKGNMVHQTSRRRLPLSNTTSSKKQHSSIQPSHASKHHSEVSKAAVNHINQLRARLSKSFLVQKENENSSSPTVQVRPSSLSRHSPPQSLHSMQRAGAWRPSLQSISERDRCLIE